MWRLRENSLKWNIIKSKLRINEIIIIKSSIRSDQIE